MDPQPGQPPATRDGIQATGAVALWIVLVYAVFAGLWIVLSDKALGWLFDDPALLILGSTMKGWLFVAVTSMLLFGFIRRRLDQARDASMREQVAQAEKAHAQQLLAAIAENSSDAIFAKDPQGRYLLFNRETARVIDKTIEQALGRDDTELFPPEQAAVIRANDRRVLTEQCINTYEEALSTKDGERVYLATKGPLRDVDGQVIGLFGIARDITDRKQAEMALKASEERYRMVLEHAADAVLVANPEGRFVYANQKASQLLDYSVEQLLAMSFRDLVPEGRLEFALSRFEQIKERGSVLIVGEMKRQDGGIVPVELNTVRLPDGSVFGACRNIADRMTAENDLRQRNEELEAFNRAAVGREIVMIELKRQINDLSRQLGQEPPYRLDFIDEAAVPRGADDAA